MTRGDAPGAPWYRQLDRQQVRGFLAAWIGYALDGFDFVLITYVLTNIATEFHVSLVKASALISAAFLTRWFGGAVVGTIADRLGRPRAMVIGVLLYAGGTFLCGLSWSYWSLFAFRLVVGMGMAGEYAASSTYAMESWPEALRNKASGFLISGYPLGGIIASQLYPLLVPHFGWRSMFFLGLAPVLVAIYIRIRLPESGEWERAEATRPSSTPKRLPALVLFGRRRIAVTLTLLVLTFVAFCSNWPIGSLMPTYLKSVGYNAGKVGTVMFAANFGLLVGTWITGFLGDRIGTRRTYVTSILISLVLILPVFILQGQYLPLVGVLVFLLQLTNYGPAGILPKYLADYFDTAVRGTGLGLVYNLGALGGAVSPVLGAYLGQHIGLGPALAVLTFGWTLLLAALIGFRVPDWVHRHTVAPAESYESAPAVGTGQPG